MKARNTHTVSTYHTLHARLRTLVSQHTHTHTLVFWFQFDHKCTYEYTASAAYFVHALLLDQ